MPDLRSAWYELTSTFPGPLRDSVRWAAATSSAYLGSVSLRRDDLIPPMRLRLLSGNGNWTRIGREYRDLFVRLGGLAPTDRVLEVGCGAGRIAGALTTYLRADGSYEGLDISPEAIAWCTAHITSRHPNFRFQLANVRNDVYNPNGTVDAASFRFPFSEGTFDFVFLTSVVTHLLPPAFENYLREVSRVLRAGGCSAITYFLLDPASIALIARNRSEMHFPDKEGSHRVADPAHPESAVAYDVGYVRGLYAQSRLDILEPIHWGTWSGRTPSLAFQDLLVAAKRGP